MDLRLPPRKAIQYAIGKASTIMMTVLTRP